MAESEHAWEHGKAGKAHCGEVFAEDFGERCGVHAVQGDAPQSDSDEMCKGSWSQHISSSDP